MKRKLVIALLTASMAITPLSVSAAEFTDGAAAVEMQDLTISPQDTGLAETDLFTDDSSAAGEGFSDSSIQDVEVFSDSAVEEAAVENGTYAAQDMYQLSVSGTLVYSEVQKFVDLLNEERAKLGLEPHKLDKEMMDLAAERAVETAIYYDHDRPDGSVLPAGGCISLEYGEADANEALESWKNSPAHWSILMAKDKGRIGFMPFTYKSIYGMVRTNYVVDLTFYDSYVPVNNMDKDINISKNINILPKYLNYIAMNINNESVLDDDNNPIPIYSASGKKMQATVLSYTGITPYSNFVTLNPECGTWVSSNPEVATVDNNGVITTVGSGKTNIYFYLNGDKDIKSEYGTIIVKDKSQKPGKPNLEGTINNYQYASFSWNKVSNADGYEVYGYNSGKKTWTKIADGTKTAYQRKIGYGKTGKFRIRAYAVENGKKAYSDYSNIVTIKTAALAPKITSVKATGSRTLTVNWQKSASAEGYMIYRYIKKNGNYNLVKTINSGDVQSFKNTGLVKGRTYWYKIKSFRINENGKKITGVYSAPVSAKCR